MSFNRSEHLELCTLCQTASLGLPVQTHNTTIGIGDAWIVFILGNAV